MMLTAAKARCCECALPLGDLAVGAAWSNVRCGGCGTRLQARSVQAGVSVRHAVPDCAPLQPVAPPALRQRWSDACRRVVALLRSTDPVEPGMASMVDAARGKDGGTLRVVHGAGSEEDSHDGCADPVVETTGKHATVAA